MFTEEQKKKAEEALNPYSNLPMFTDFEKSIAFSNHKQAIEWITKFNLPYRINLDLIKDRITLHKCFPYPGYKKSDLIHLKPNEIMPWNPDKEPDENGYRELGLFAENAETRQQIEEHNKKLRPWDLSTAAGLQKWEYYFAHLLNAAQFSEYSYFDYFGIKTAPNEEQEKNQQKIDYWKNLQANYQLHQDKYYNPADAETYNPDDYTLHEFIPDWNESTQYDKNNEL